MKSKKPEFVNAIPAGTYEVIVDACNATEHPKDGRYGVKFDFRIRDDVEQPCKGRHIFKSFYISDTGEFPEEKVGEFANACGVEDGAEYEPWELRLKTCQIVVKQFSPEDKPNEKVSYVAYARKSKLEPIKESDSSFTDVSTDDSPFV